MPAYCLDCLNRLENHHLTKRDVILCEEADLCDGCGEIKPIVVKLTDFYLQKEIERQITLKEAHAKENKETS